MHGTHFERVKLCVCTDIDLSPTTNFPDVKRWWIMVLGKRRIIQPSELFQPVFSFRSFRVTEYNI